MPSCLLTLLCEIKRSFQLQVEGLLPERVGRGGRGSDPKEGLRGGKEELSGRKEGGEAIKRRRRGGKGEIKDLRRTEGQGRGGETKPQGATPTPEAKP